MGICRVLALILLPCDYHIAEDAKMASGWHFHEDTTPTPGEVEAMVAVLEGRHGAWAADVAEFFATLHSLKGDVGRSWAWAGVAEMARRKAEARVREQYC